MKNKLNIIISDWLNGKVPFCGMGSREKECIEPLDGMKIGVHLLKELKQLHEDNTDRVLAKIDDVRDCFEK